MIDTLLGRIKKLRITKELKSLEMLPINSLGVWLTKRCNANCFFCPVVHSKSKQDDLSLIEIDRIAKQISSIYPDIQSISFSGGEPLLRKDIKDILVIFKNYFRNVKFILYTNGILFDSIGDLLESFDNISISFHSISKYEEIFGVRFGPERVIKNIENLSEDIKKKIELSVGISHINCQDFDEVLSFAQDTGINRINLFPIRYDFDKSYSLSSNYRIIHESINWKSVFEIVKRFDNKLTIIPCIHNLKKLASVYERQTEWQFPCRSPLHRMVVDYSARIRLCCGNQPPIGDVFSLDLKNLVQNTIVQEILSNAINRTGVCKYCPFSIDPCFICSYRKHISKVRQGIGEVFKQNK